MKQIYRTVIREYPRLGCIHEATYRLQDGSTITKYWASRKGVSVAKEFDTESVATAYLHIGVFK